MLSLSFLRRAKTPRHRGVFAFSMLLHQESSFTDPGDKQECFFYGIMLDSSGMADKTGVMSAAVLNDQLVIIPIL